MNSRHPPGAGVVGIVDRSGWPPVTGRAPIRAHESGLLLRRFCALIEARVRISMGAPGDGREVVAEMVGEAAVLLIQRVVQPDGLVGRAFHPRGTVAVLRAQAERVGMDPDDLEEQLRVRAWREFDEVVGMRRPA